MHADYTTTRNGTVRPALENAALQQDVEQMRTEVQAVCNFLRDNNPNPEQPAQM